MENAPAALRLRLALADEAATARLAQDVAAVLRRRDLVALSGGLGVGKTSFARALIRALADDPALDVPSPTFPLRVDHALPRFPVAHADLYRVAAAEELQEIGLDDALGEAALVVEWPKLLPDDLTENRLDIALEIFGTGRNADIRAAGSWPQRLARSRQIREFLDAKGLARATRVPMAGDASVRAYERIGGERTAILMNAPARLEGPAVYDGRSYDAVAHRALDVRPFIAIDRALRAGGVRAPEILGADLDAGLLLLEDLGGDGVLDAAGAPIIERYEAAIDLLAFMHGRDWPIEATFPGGVHRIPPYDREALLIEISLFPDWFSASAGEKPFWGAERAGFLAAWSEILAEIEGRPKTWVLRDFHSPNILWQADAAGIVRVGVIDFQDALIGDPAYDVASLAQDARVPLTPDQEERLKSRYIAARRADDRSFDLEGFETAYTVLATQRATKVLGAFTRLAVAEGKRGYQQHRTRLKGLIRQTLRHPVLSALRVWYEPYL